MAMNVQATGEADEAGLNTTINTTPLVDVMLVLLIIFLVTIPVIVKTVPVHLPNARNIATVTKPENIVVAIDKNENMYWNNAPIGVEELRPRFGDALKRALGRGTPLPEVHIRADSQARFQAVGKVILAAQEAGVPKIGFLTEPRNDEAQ